LIASDALAQADPTPPDCVAQATEKRLHGAALKSFMKKCERDAAAASCEAAAVDKKLAGAAKTSFKKKCINNAATKQNSK
jgi:hypothetical protein